ncbi:MAG: hypothetical protein ACI4F1_06335 [Bariatricus sp.]
MAGYKRRCLALVMLICALLGGMTGCGPDAEDASAYVQADMDLIFQGEKEGAKQFLEASDQELEEMYENGITAFVENYLTGTDESQQALTESYAYLVKEIFRAMRYQVGEGQKKNGSTFEVEVQYEPADVFTTFIPKLKQETERIEQDARNGKYEGTDEEIQQAMMSEYLVKSYELLKESYISMDYLEKETYTFTVTKEGRGTLSMDEDEINTFLVRILALDKL